MKSRIEILNDISNHPWMGKIYGRLDGDERRFLTHWIEQNLTLPTDDFEIRVNRIFLDSDSKPKRWLEILEILSFTNSEYGRQEKNGR